MGDVVESVGGSLLGGAVMGPVGSLLGGAGGGGGAPQGRAPFVNWQGGGFRTSLDDGQLTVSRTPRRRDAVQGIQDVLRGQAEDIAGLRSDYLGANSALRNTIQESNQAALDRIRDAEQKAIGDLRQNLGRRRVLGSSFAQDALSRSRAEFGRKMAEQEAEAGQRLQRNRLQELDAVQQLIDREAEAERRSYQAALDDMGLEADFASQMGSQAQQQINRNARLRAEAARQRSQGIGSLLGTIGGGALGFMAGGPAGALGGAQLGGRFLGGGSGTAAVL